MKIKTNKLPKSIVEIEGELDAPIFESYFSPALKRLGENLEIDGFRKGKAPETVLLSKIPEARILEEMAELALSEHYPKILEEEKIDAIGRPEISITKLARNNPLGFKIKASVLPGVTLPDYKKIAKKIVSENKNKGITVTEEEVETTILDIRKSRAPKINIQDAEKVKEEAEKAPELPELNDEFVKSLGPFKDVEDFKTKLKENIKLEKENQARERIRLQIAEKIIEESKIEVPEILIESELDKIIYKMESDITQMGLKFEDYLKHINKTVEDLKKEFYKDGEKKSKLSLVLHKISEIENIKAPEEEVAKEVAHLLEHYKDADPERARMHAENILTNERIFQFLESQ